ncbi:hypothetical protein [Paenibacillus tyrfis]|uniref:hypothetical protein n=1 Tax=Paenibacillus tyrfis TaxID=1501230 RepID=UPI000B58B5C3|nr:hypothetical protein [Paenibacillus tyrfis]
MFNLEEIKQRENYFRSLLNADRSGKKFFDKNFEEVKQYLNDKKDLIEAYERLQTEIEDVKPVHLKERKGNITKIGYRGAEYAFIHPTTMRTKGGIFK